MIFFHYIEGFNGRNFSSNQITQINTPDKCSSYVP